MARRFPEELIIYDKNDSNKIIYQRTFTKKESIKNFKDGGIPQSFFDSLGLPSGTYMCRLITKNYERGMSLCCVGPQCRKNSASKERSDSHLPPKEGPLEIQSDYIISLKREGFMIITGFIVDDESGFPLEGARVRLADGSVEARTDKRGYFFMRIPVPAEFEGPVATADIVFEKDGFESVERRNVEIWSKGDSIYHFRLKPGEGCKVEDERKFRRR